MKKIVSLFQRSYDGDRSVRNEVVPGSEWVANGQGVATRKWDGTCCLISNGEYFKRYEVKKGKTPPPNFKPANDIDKNTGKQQGWVPVGEGAEDCWHREAFNTSLPDGTYELVGPKIQCNPDDFDTHTLVPHGKEIIQDAPRDYDGLIEYLSDKNIEGIVWHHPDGRMVKIKKKDFPKSKSQ
ncbi:RNA ligase 1 family protein [Rubritalea sp.]|uniref:RNA ligase 1 family protein n=1 Tax=Rubritalea sp. TaxID=2109375 RepID=UPI003EF945A9